MNRQGIEQTDKFTPYVLFADRDEATLSNYRVSATRRGWRGEFAQDAYQIVEKVEALAEQSESVYDAVVLGVDFTSLTDDRPQLTGLDAGETIRKLLPPSIPIVFVTRHAGFHSRRAMEKLGAHVILKPVRLDSLFAEIETMMNDKRGVKKAADPLHALMTLNAYVNQQIESSFIISLLGAAFARLAIKKIC